MDVFIEDNNGSLLSCGESIAVSVKKKHSKFSVKKNKFASSVVVVVVVAVAVAAGTITGGVFPPPPRPRRPFLLHVTILAVVVWEHPLVL